MKNENHKMILAFGKCVMNLLKDNINVTCQSAIFVKRENTEITFSIDSKAPLCQSTDIWNVMKTISSPKVGSLVMPRILTCF